MDSDDTNPILEEAAQLSRAEALSQLIDQGVLDPQASAPEDLASAQVGGKALLDAAARGDARQVLLLLKAGANPVARTPAGLQLSDLEFALPGWLHPILGQFAQRWAARQAHIEQEAAEARLERARASVQQAQEASVAQAEQLTAEQEAVRNELRAWMHSLLEAYRQRVAQGQAQAQQLSQTQRERLESAADREAQLWANEQRKHAAQLALLRQRFQETLAHRQAAQERLQSGSGTSGVARGDFSGTGADTSPSNNNLNNTNPNSNNNGDPDNLNGSAQETDLRELEARQLREHYERERQLIEAQRQLPALPSLATFRQHEEARSNSSGSSFSSPAALPDVERLAAVASSSSSTSPTTTSSTSPTSTTATLAPLCEECEEAEASLVCDSCGEGNGDDGEDSGVRLCGPCSARVHQASKRLRAHVPRPLLRSQSQAQSQSQSQQHQQSQDAHQHSQKKSQPHRESPETSPNAKPQSPQPAAVTTDGGPSLKERMARIGGAAAFNPAMMMGSGMGGSGGESAAAQHLRNKKRGQHQDHNQEQDLEHHKRPAARSRRAKPSRTKRFQLQHDDGEDQESPEQQEQGDFEEDGDDDANANEDTNDAEGGVHVDADQHAQEVRQEQLKHQGVVGNHSNDDDFEDDDDAEDEEDDHKLFEAARASAQPQTSNADVSSSSSSSVVEPKDVNVNVGNNGNNNNEDAEHEEKRADSNDHSNNHNHPSPPSGSGSGRGSATAAVSGLDPASVEGAWAELCNLESPTNWIACGFENPDSNRPTPLVRVGSGAGGLAELVSYLGERPQQILYAGLLVMAVDARGGVSSKRAKLIRIDWMGARVPVSRRRLALASKEAVNTGFTGCTLSLAATDAAEITAQRIGQSLLQSGGAHKPQAFLFGGEQKLELHEIVGGDGFHRGDAQSEVYGF